MTDFPHWAIDMGLALLLAIPFGFVVAVNVWYWHRRNKLTPDERTREDQSLRIPGDW